MASAISDRTQLAGTLLRADIILAYMKPDTRLGDEQVIQHQRFQCHIGSPAPQSFFDKGKAADHSPGAFGAS